MVFSSTVFLFVYLPLTLAVYYAVPFKVRNWVLFALSLAFYGWGEPVYIAVMLASVTVAYACGFPIAKYKDSQPNRARIWLWISLGVNLSFLLFFKYTNFIIETIRLIPALSDTVFPIEGLELPIGISFYTFQIMSYSIDLYRGQTAVQKNYIAFGTYVSLFPQLIAGPIVRYRDVDSQLSFRTHSAEKFAAGVKRFIIGFSKKLLLGDTLAAVYAYFSTAQNMEPTVLSGWMMLITFTLHIYFDFSGYSDMAIGLGRMFGFEFPENFNYPYIAGSVTDFWRRWHMSLSSWFREYIYIPLGGNRYGKVRQYFNLAVVWFLTGLWHGASWNFVLWGIFYLLILVIEKAGLLSFFRRSRLAKSVGHIWTLLTVGIGWMIFDHTDLTVAGSIIGSLCGIGVSGLSSPALTWTALHSLPLVAVSCAAATPLPAKIGKVLRRKLPIFFFTEPLILLFLLILSVACMVSGAYSPFLYYIF